MANYQRTAAQWPADARWTSWVVAAHEQPILDISIGAYSTAWGLITASAARAVPDRTTYRMYTALISGLCKVYDDSTCLRLPTAAVTLPVSAARYVRLVRCLALAGSRFRVDGDG